MTNLEEDFVDILEEQRTSRDISLALRNWHYSPCQYSLNRSPREIKEQVLASESIQNILKKSSSQNEQPVEEVRASAVAIINEMAHNLQLKVIRIISFLLTKFLKQVYSGIFVNMAGIKKVANVSDQYPILFLPTHRSYADFLLVSYICYQFDLPIPVVAAGLDFLGMNTISPLLRGAGAFFIRRSFVDDRLYWEIFNEYVKSHIKGCEFPMEFFIEGTRSRTGKSLVPKIGMLRTIMEEFFASKIPDITVVPISISYDRTLEETLFAHELIGVPKPKETTTGLLKARTILSSNFGTVYIHFGDPISCKEFFSDHCRSMRNLHSRNSSLSSEEEQRLCQDLATHVIHTHQKNLLLSPFTIICLVIGHPSFSRTGGVQYDIMVDMVIWLQRLVERTGVTVYFGNMTPFAAVLFHIKKHSNIIEVTPDSFISTKDLPENEILSASDKVVLQTDTIKDAVPSMFLYHYANQSLQLLVHFCIICMAMNSNREKTTFSRDYIYLGYNVLRKLLQREFVFAMNNAEMDFHNALQTLKNESILAIRDGVITILDNSREKVTFLKQLVIHFLESYRVICYHLLSLNWGDGVCDYGSLAQRCQVAIEHAIINGIIKDHKCLSLDMINNCFKLLVTQKALRREKRNGQCVVLPCHPKILDTLHDIEIFITPQEQRSWIVSSIPNVDAKL